MKEIRKIPQLSIVRILYICILIVHLLMLALGVNAQSVKPELAIKAGFTISPQDPRISRVREIYTSQIGVREKGSNTGREVEEYLRYVNLPKGNPWCAAFVCWVLGKAGITNPRSGWSPLLFGERRIIWGGESGIKNQEPGFGGGKPDRFTMQTVDGNMAASRCARPPVAWVGGGFCIHTTRDPGPGDVFGLYFPEKGRIAHVGFVDEWKDGWVTTVEGNTNVLGSRDGDGVYRKRRLVRSVYKVARYVQ